MDTQWIRKYRTDSGNAADPRPAILGGGYITSDSEDATYFTASAIANHGNVVMQKSFLMNDGVDLVRQTRKRFKEAERAEARP